MIMNNMLRRYFVEYLSEVEKYCKILMQYFVAGSPKEMWAKAFPDRRRNIVTSTNTIPFMYTFHGRGCRIDKENQSETIVDWDFGTDERPIEGVEPWFLANYIKLHYPEDTIYHSGITIRHIFDEGVVKGEFIKVDGLYYRQ